MSEAPRYTMKTRLGDEIPACGLDPGSNSKSQPPAPNPQSQTRGLVTCCLSLARRARNLLSLGRREGLVTCCLSLARRARILLSLSLRACNLLSLSGLDTSYLSLGMARNLLSLYGARNLLSRGLVTCCLSPGVSAAGALALGRSRLLVQETLATV